MHIGIYTIEFLGLWEELHNPNFNRVQFEAVRSEAWYAHGILHCITETGELSGTQSNCI
jgi:hypothetical protein